MFCSKAVPVLFLLAVHPQLAVAQPFLYIGTAGSFAQASVCAIPTAICPESAVELYNAATGTVLNSHQFGIAGLGGFITQDMTAAPDGRRVFAVTRAGVVAIDTLTNHLTPIFPDTSGYLEMSSDGTRVFFANGSVVRVIDAVSLVVLSSITLPGPAQDLARSPDGAYLYASHLSSDTVSQIRIDSNTVVGTLSVPDPAGIGVAADGSRLYVVNMGQQTVTVVDVATGAIVATVSVTLPIGSFTAGKVVVSSTTAYISGLGHSSVVFLDVASNTVARVVTVESPVGLALSSDGGQLFVAAASGAVVLDSGTGAVVGAVPTLTPAIALAVLAPVPCLYEATVSPRAVPTGGGVVTLTIPAAPTCSWAVSSASWITPATSSGSGPATIPLTVAPADAPRSGGLQIAAQQFVIQQTVPEIHVDLPGGQTLTQPAVVTGWAIDRDDSTSGASSPGVDAIHVWAYPAVGGAPIWVGTASYGAPRSDVLAQWGTRYEASGFSADVRGLAAGSYTLVFYAHSSRSATFSAAVPLPVSLLRVPAQVIIDTPAPGARVRGSFVIGGWAIDAGAAGAPGIDAVHVWAYPDSGAAPQFVGSAEYGHPRADVGAVFGDQFTNSGFDLVVQGLQPGPYLLAVFARSSDTGLFNPASVVSVTVAASDPRMYVDVPAANATVQGAFAIGGWALDLAAPSGSGVDAVHAWAYPLSGGAPVFAGAATPVPRPDVAAVFGSQYGMAGFHLAGATLPAGTYDLVVYARSSVVGAFNNSVVVRITVQ